MAIKCKEYGILLAVVMFAMSTMSFASTGERIKFTFAPEDKVSFVQKITTTKESDVGGKAKLKDESITTSKITITKTETGWEVNAQPTGISMFRNGEEINDPIASLMSNAKVTYILDRNGNVLDIKGYEEYVEEISRKIDPEKLKRYASVLNVDVLKAKEIAEWKGRVGDFAGMEAGLGETQDANVPYQLPDGSTITYSIQTTITGREPCGTRKCVRVSQEYDSDADNAARLSGSLVNSVASAVAPDVQKTSSGGNTATIHGIVKRVIDPDTMLIYEEDVTRHINMSLDIPGSGPVSVTRTERRKYEFTY